MSDKPQSSSSLPEVRPTSESSGSPIAVFDAATRLPVGPQMLTEGLRELEKRIPGYVHLSVEEERSRMRTAFLDPEYIQAGIEAAVNWDEAKTILGASGEELRAAQGEIAHWDESIAKCRALLEGLEGANVERRYELGQKILLLYSILKTTIDFPNRRHLRPYLETMKRAYMRRRKKPSKAEAGEGKGTGSEPQS